MCVLTGPCTLLQGAAMNRGRERAGGGRAVGEWVSLSALALAPAP